MNERKCNKCLLLKFFANMVLLKCWVTQPHDFFFLLNIPILSEVAHFQGHIWGIGNSPSFQQLWMVLVSYRDVSRRDHVRDHVIQVTWWQRRCRPSFSGAWGIRDTCCSGVLTSTRSRNPNSSWCNKGSMLVPTEKSWSRLGFEKGRGQPCFQGVGFCLCSSFLVIGFLPGLTFYLVIGCLLAVPCINLCPSKNRRIP